MDSYKPAIKYSTQITDDKKLYIEIENYEDFEILERNIQAKILKDIQEKMRELQSNRTSTNNQTSSTNTNEINTTTSTTAEKVPGSYYNVYGTDDSPIYFYNTPNDSDRKNSRFTTNEKVYVESINGDFGFVRFTNTNNQTTTGWIRLIDLN